MLEEFDSFKTEMFQVMDPAGNITKPEHFPKLKDKDIVGAYKKMLFARTADLMVVSYQRQGRIYTYPPNQGQEAISGAVAQIIRKDDWLVPAFRELGAWLAKGASLKEIFMYFMGFEEGSLFKNARNMLPMNVPIASQLQHATGIGYAINYKEKDEIVYTFVGDGGTSQGDFHEALNFAAVWKVPVIFIVQNNQFAISVPFKTQTASDGIAIKALAYGMPGIQVDGNDFLAMTKTFEEASEHAGSGKGPVLIEAVTYRMGAHTTSDDPSKYRTKEEEDEWAAKDPLVRLKKYLMTQKLWTDKEEETITGQYKKEIDRIFIEAEKHTDYPLEDVLKYQYADLPDDLLLQKAEHEKFLNWKASRK